MPMGISKNLGGYSLPSSYPMAPSLVRDGNSKTRWDQLEDVNHNWSENLHSHNTIVFCLPTFDKSGPTD